jgi:hypothetical protein
VGRKKTRRIKKGYTPEKSLQATTLDPTLETCARDLYTKACCGSAPYWPDIESESTFRQNIELQKKFLSSAHEGMRSAQNYIVDQVNSNPNLSVSEELLYRGIADSIAWQFLGGQLCHARRLYKGQRQPNLQESNFSSVVDAARSIVEKDEDAMPLISDLTSFVQVGDILSMASEKGLSIVEVKEGEKNRKISEFLDLYSQSGCDRALSYFLSAEGPKVAKQMSRMARQMARMSHTVEIMNSGTSTDPDSDQKIKIPDEFIDVDEWYPELNHVIKESEDKGLALHVVEKCLFFACYSHGPLFPAGHVAFNVWFDGCGGDAESPRSRFMDCMQAPLALPIFLQPIPDECKLDILFGRKQILMGINVKALLEQCESIGLSVRPGTNKETSKLEQAGAKPFRHKGKSIYIGKGDKEMALMGGMFMRALFHGQKPVSLIEAILSHAVSN